MRPKFTQDNIFYFTWLLLVTFFGYRVLHWEDGVFQARGFSQWIDTPVHLSYIQHFLNTPITQWFSEHPLNPEVKFSYHFLPDLISAFLVKLGFSYKWSLSLPIIIATMGFIRESHKYFYTESKNGLITKFTISSFLLLGGVGFYYLLFESPNMVRNNFEATNFVSQSGDILGVFMAPLTGVFFAQRGIPFGLWFLFLTLNKIELSNNTKRRAWLSIGNTLLLFTQIHASMILHFLLGFKFLFERKKSQFIDILLIFITSIGVFYLFYFTPETKNYISTIKGLGFGNAENKVLLSWYGTSFLLFPILAITIAYKRVVNYKLAFALFIFGMINFIKFQPNDWDNSKFYYLSVIFLIFYIFNSLKKIKHSRLIASTIFLTLSISGIFDFFLVSTKDRVSFALYSTKDLAFAEALEARIGKGARIITENKHNHVFTQVTSLKPVLGFHYNLDTYGHDRGYSTYHISNILIGKGKDHFLKHYDVKAIIIKKNGLYRPKEYNRIQWFLRTQGYPEADLKALSAGYEVLMENDEYIVFNPKIKRTYLVKRQL